MEAVVPKFTFETESRLSTPLVEMGLGKIFTDPDFSGMSPELSLAVSEVFHKTFVAVDEGGAEASCPKPAQAVISRPMQLAIRTPTKTEMTPPPFTTDPGWLTLNGRLCSPTPIPHHGTQLFHSQIKVWQDFVLVVHVFCWGAF